MEITQTDNGTAGTIRAMEGEVEAGIMTYTWHDEHTFTIEHTIGNPDFKGVGIKLLDKAVAFARDKGLKIIPQCPFAKKMFERKPELADVLAHY
jgi:uncharacterized protein